MKFRRFLLFGIWFGLLSLLPNVRGSAYFLQGNDWNIVENWYANVVPSGERTYIGRDLTVLADVGFTNYAENLYLGLTDGFLWGDAPGEKIYLAGTGSLVVGGTLNTARPYIGAVVFDAETGLPLASARGSLVVAGGSLSYGNLDQVYGDYSVSSGTVDSGDTWIGTANGFNVTTTISSDSHSTTVFNAGFGSEIHVGCARNNSHLSVSGSNTTVNAAVNVGDAPESVGTATISDGARLNGSLNVGASGNGTLDIQTGATVVGDGSIGTAAGFHGTANVQTGGTWDAGGISVGISGTGVLNINGGNVTSSQWSVLGSSDGSLGVVNVTTGTWTHSTSLAVGYDGTGILNIDGGAVIANSQDSAFYIASPSYNPGSQGTVNVTAGELKTRYLYVGNGGSAELNISGGTVTTSVDAAVGDDSTASVTGGTWGIDGNLSVRSYTEGMTALNVGGGTVNVSGTTSVGQGQDSRGTANVTDGELRTASLSVGAQGAGELNISGGQVITNNHAIIGGKDIGYSYYWDASWYEGNGTVNVTGGSWEVGGDIILGSEHHVYLDAYTAGTLNVDGGTVSAGNIYVGKYGAGILDIDAGTINITGQIVVAEYAGSHGTLSFNGGSLNVSSIVVGSGSATVNFNQTGNTTVDFGLTGNTEVNVTANGTTTLTAANTYAGKTTIHAGTLILTSDASIDNSSEINLGDGGCPGNLRRVGQDGIFHLQRTEVDRLWNSQPRGRQDADHLRNPGAGKQSRDYLGGWRHNA